MEFVKLGGKISPHAENFPEFMRLRVIIVNPSNDEIEVCKRYFPENEVAYAIHTATCFKTNAILISDDGHFDLIRQSGLISDVSQM